MTEISRNVSPARSPKIQRVHLERLAVVYVRQSSPQQVIEHVESTARQYGLTDRAEALGWPADSIVVIDDDQGQSGQSLEGRLGFQRLLAEVSLDHVGIVLALEMSRLARSCKDWHQLLELCGVFGTLLADADGIYDPRDPNDRLLLGLRGMMSEAELHTIKSRLIEGKRHKAQRGELLNHPPIGYVRGTSGDYELDPDQQAQSVVRLVFDQFERQGSLHGLLRWLVTHEVRLPVRPHFGPHRGQLEWHRPTRMTLQNLLHHPIYAGGYRWGYRTIDPRRQQPGRRSTGRTVHAFDECEVLIPERFPAYISWERFLAIQERLEANRAIAEALGAAREGTALLSGLLICGRCGRRMAPVYGNAANRLRYVCQRAMIDYGEPLCQSLSGDILDRLMAEQVLEVLKPAALECSLAAAADLEHQREALHQNWRQRLERAAYDTERAHRQYAAVEPENRLVARELEQRWEAALRDQQSLERDYHRFLTEQPAKLTAGERALIQQLAQDVPTLWHAQQTTNIDRQEIVRCLVDHVRVTVQGESELVDVVLCWAGGFESTHRVVRPVGRYEQLSYYEEMLQRIESLRQENHSWTEVAEVLNQEGFRPPKRTETFTQAILSRLWRERHAPPGGGPADNPSRPLGTRCEDLNENEWWLADLARVLDMPTATLHRWRRQGWLSARQLALSQGRWAIWADAEELDRLNQLRQFQRKWPTPRYPLELTTPKPRPSDSP
jgi:DNA invertase Pin-like site-specific DNA recombinase